jgi:glucokinase
LADIGGTNARFALLIEGEITREASLPVAVHPGPREAIEYFLGFLGEGERPRHAALAFAGPVEGETARLTNGAWEVGSLGRGPAASFRVREAQPDQ